MKRSYLKIALLVALPLALFGLAKERLSWRPRILRPAAPSATPKEVADLLWATDNRKLLVRAGRWSQSERWVELWDVASRARRRRFSIDFRPQTTDVRTVLAPQGHWAMCYDAAMIFGAVAGMTSAPVGICVWNVDTGQLVRLPATMRDILGMGSSNDWLGFTSDEQLQVAAMTTEGLKLWAIDLKTEKVREDGIILTPKDYCLSPDKTASGEYPIPRYVFSPDGRTLVVELLKIGPGPDKRTHWLQSGLLVYDMQRRKYQRLPAVPRDLPHNRRLMMSHDGQTVVVGLDQWSNGPATFDVWDVKAGKLRRTLQDKSGWMACALSPNGTCLAISNLGQFNTVHLWDTQTGQLARAWQEPHGSVTALAFAPNGRDLATGDGIGEVKLWRVK